MKKQNLISRRSFVKAAVVVGVSASAGSLLSACVSGESSQNVSSETQETDSQASQDAAGQSQVEAGSNETGSTSQAEQPSETASAAGGGSVLVAYFSATGHTQNVAEAIAADLGATTFVITPAQAYSSEDINYNNESSRVYVEHAQGGVDVDLVQTSPDDWDSYDTVFVGYPTWWGEASWVLRNFVKGNDFTGKTVVPFTTSASSPLGSSAQNLAELCGTGNWGEGRRFGGSASASEVTEWLREIGY